MELQKLMSEVIAPIIALAFAIFVIGCILVVFIDHYTGIVRDAVIRRKVKKGSAEVITAYEYLTLAKRYPNEYSLEPYVLKNLYYYGDVDDYVKMFHKDAKRLYQAVLEQEHEDEAAKREAKVRDAKRKIQEIRSKKEAESK